MKLPILLTIIMLSFCINPLIAQTQNVDSLNTEIRKLKEKILLDSIQKEVATKYRSQDSINYNARFDELKKDFLDLKMETSDVKLNLRKSHKEYRVGTIMYFVGITAAFIGATLPTHTEYNNGGYVYTGVSSPLTVPLIVMGTLSSITGTFLWVNSHRLIGKAGKSWKGPKYRRAGY
jgi:hypothetical protein